MEYIHGTSNFSLEKECAVTLGKFDGVHLGHQKLIALVCEKAKEEGMLAAVFTFEQIPLSLCPQKNQHFLTTNVERRNICASLGLDVEIEHPFNDELMNMEAEDFISDIIVGKLRAKYVIVGPDCSFGKDRRGNCDMLISMSEKYGFSTIVVEKERFQDREISSTYVREELKLGHMETVNVLLNRPFSITGIVEMGHQLGRTIDIPTMNVYPASNKLLPPNGVYASVVNVDGKDFYGVTNIGVRPTVSDSQIVSVESNLFNFSCDNAYGKTIEVKLMHFLRPEMKFENVNELQKQMETDSAFAKDMFLIN